MRENLLEIITWLFGGGNNVPWWQTWIPMPAPGHLPATHPPPANAGLPTKKDESVVKNPNVVCPNLNEISSISIEWFTHCWREYKSRLWTHKSFLKDSSSTFFLLWRKCWKNANKILIYISKDWVQFNAHVKLGKLLRQNWLRDRSFTSKW